MSAKRNIGNEMIQSMQDAVKYMRGKKKKAVTHKVVIPDIIDVKSIRKNLNLSRPEFADRYGFSSRTLQHWEQGDRRPHGAAKVLLVLLQREPEVIEQILNPTKKTKASKRTIISALKISQISSHKITPKRKEK
ncbi:MAG TPA: type II toxin-antitoxin system MqsA family antitoxin [Gammaproteobacteria bacterium]|nr:type II toxin-antitoxin system MqsA family antitoxin [Gammaproteobacteria bacterium]